MITRGVAAMMILLLLIPASEYAANPFLNTLDNKPISSEFRGSEWSDEIDQEEIPLRARASTTRIATMPWGRNLQDRIQPYKIARGKTTRNSTELLHRD